MLDVNLKNLIGRLNATCSSALKEAARACLARTHFDVDIGHFLLALLADEKSDLHPVLRQWSMSAATVSSEVEKSLRGLRSGNAATPTFSPHLMRWLQSAWVVASVDHGDVSIRSSHLLLALLKDDEFVYRAREMAPSLRDIDVRQLDELLEQLVEKSPEAPVPGAATAGGPAGTGPAGMAGAASGGGAALAQFSIDLTAEARAGKFDAIVGRDGEIRQVIDILLRRRKNNPIIVGEAGVGKTAVVEGLAQRIAAGDVPGPLKGVTLRALDLTLLQAGAGVKGEFENRLKDVIKEVKSSPTPIILFIDEAHTMIGAGGQAGSGDAANLLKPALARGELRTIAATTYAEFKKHIEKDPALERRFQPVHVGEPDQETAIRMMRQTADFLERHHGVRILDEAVRAAVGLGARYISGRNLPDKAVDLLDTACARVALARASTPEALETCQHGLDAVRQEMGVLQRESAAADADHTETVAALKLREESLITEVGALETRLQQEREAVERLVPARAALEARALGKELPKETPEALCNLSVSELRAHVETEKAALAAIQGESPLMWTCVDQDVVADVISAWTGIPAGRMVADEIVAIQNLRSRLEARVVGQTGALEEIVKRIQTSRAGLEDPNKPIGVFLMTGPSGVGKTETALALAETLYGGERNLISINMSEYQESHSVSGLKGSPKGYVGYGEGGALTEPVRQRPYSVVLLDEVEKAHSDVMEVFYQVFDKGMLEDTTGRVVSFRNTVIIMCSNLGGDQMVQATVAAGGILPGAEEARDIVMPALRHHFPAAFLGRVVVLPFGPLSDDIMANVTRLKLEKIRKRLLSEHGTRLEFHDDVIRSIVDRCVEVESGARNVDNIVTNSLLPVLGRKVLSWMVEGQMPESVVVRIGQSGAVLVLADGEEPQEPFWEPPPEDEATETAGGDGS